MFARLLTFATRASLIVGICALVVAAQDYMPPDRPPPADWQVQGEYFGTYDGTSDNLGAWVIGMGGDNYNVVFLAGGLLTLPNRPYGGWDKTSKVAASGPAANITSTSGYKASITGTGEDRTLKGTNNSNKAFTLKRVVRTSPTLGISPKTEWNAERWFRFNNTSDLTLWKSNPATPQLKYGGYLYRGITCTKTHTTVYLHIEVRSPYCPTCRDQDRGNSGIYMRGMHEMQVLDSFGLTGANNELGSIYRVKAPLVNAALPPLTWQTYDCFYTPGSTANSATLTMYLNGVLVQDKSQVTGITEAGFAGNSVYLQDHGHDVVFNNIWAVAGATETSIPWQSVLTQDTTKPVILLNGREQRSPSSQRMGNLLARPGATSLINLLGRDLGVLDADKLIHPRISISAPAGKDD